MTISLNGQWLLACVQRSAIQDLHIDLPGDVHSALYAAGEIPDPYWATNEKKFSGLVSATGLSAATLN